MSDDELNQKLLHLFAKEAQEAIEAIIQSCLALEQQPGKTHRSEVATNVLRQVHNLKGASRALDLEEIVALTHRLESLFNEVKDADVEPETAVFDLIYLTLDSIGNLVAEASPINISMDLLLNKLETAVENIRVLKATIDQPLTAEATPPDTKESYAQETIRVTAGKLDAIFDLVNELQVTRLGLESNLAQMRHILYDSEPFTPQMNASPSLRAQFNDLYRHTEANHRHLSQLLSQLQENVRRARMLPLATVFNSLPRIARNLGRELGKEVALHVEGGEIEIDRSVLEQIKSPLQHLLYNGIDHGLEAPEKRRAAGKPETGRITIVAAQRGSSILIEVSDDGAGIDLARVKEHAVRHHFLTDDEAQRLDDQETIWLLFQSGFSTVSDLTAISGRGVGLDIVRQTVESMQGVINVENFPGQGTRFSLSLPVSIATSLCLLVRANGQIFALPTRNVLHLTGIWPGRVHVENERLFLTHPEAEPIPAVSLAHALLFDSQPADLSATQAYQTTVLIGSPEQPAALLVDELDEVQEIVIKKLPTPFAQMPYFSGASVLGTGAVILVLNVTDLIRAATHQR